MSSCLLLKQTCLVYLYPVHDPDLSSCLLLKQTCQVCLHPVRDPDLSSCHPFCPVDRPALYTYTLSVTRTYRPVSPQPVPVPAAANVRRAVPPEVPDGQRAVQQVRQPPGQHPDGALRPQVGLPAVLQQPQGLPSVRRLRQVHAR